MEKSKIVRIWPVSWKIFVQGQPQVQQVRDMLCDLNFDVSEPALEPDLADPPVYAFTAAPAEGTTLTLAELETLLQQFHDVELAFASH